MELIEKILNGANIRESIEQNDLLEMANILGKNVEKDVINFSFYFSSKVGVKHDIRAKIKWNRDRFRGGEDGYIELHGNYTYVQSKDGIKATASDINKARQFFKKYKVLFAAVWEDVLDPSAVQDYLRNILSFEGLKKEFDFDYTIFKDANNIADLEQIVRENNLFKMHD